MKFGLAGMLLLCALRAPLWSETLPVSATAQAGVTVTAAPSPVSTPQVKVEGLGHSGFLYEFSFSQWSLQNASPLAYTPFEIGYDFGNGARLQTGIDIFDYLGKENDPNGVPQQYGYEMTDWRTSLLYRVPLPMRLRPLLGVSLNAVGGSRKLAPDFEGGVDINANASKISAWSYLGCGVQGGLEYLLNPDWSLELSLRYDFTFNLVPSPIVTQLGLAVIF